MEAEPSRVSSAEAVMLGALAPGVNGATWNTLKMAFLMLGVCLAAMLGLAFSSSDSSLIFHVAFLLLIAATLFVLLTGYSNFNSSLFLIRVEFANWASYVNYETYITMHSRCSVIFPSGNYSKFGYLLSVFACCQLSFF
ncbi:uncharacterized protein LOC130985499 isoform X1 [Salvia miltiorrhiza]|uniref:uncharacterized protein LOC130985499 isoform X1 n=1 Tax=Salvia miltiorrhiza TaxID=226208 RepID=UPI0025AC6E86|nr:uncharacterized protein LOC130985499 isoform X1 [Salvia miltiorrhiza]